MSYESREPREVKFNVSRFTVYIGLIAGLIALAGAWVILPYRVDEVEKKVRTHEVELATQKEILIRIDENVKELRRAERRVTRADP